jgi:hypothetical protein
MQDKLPSLFDVIISNPPFSIKKQVLQKLFELDKPFCLLIPLEALGRKYLNQYLTNRKEDITILLPKRKVHFEPVKPINNKKSNSPFHSIWFCYKMGTPLDQTNIQLIISS